MTANYTKRMFHPKLCLEGTLTRDGETLSRCRYQLRQFNPEDEGNHLRRYVWLYADDQSVKLLT